jgi:hypothetical protein
MYGHRVTRIVREGVSRFSLADTSGSIAAVGFAEEVVKNPGYPVKRLNHGRENSAMNRASRVSWRHGNDLVRNR